MTIFLFTKMTKFILGKKIGMTTVYADDKARSVTLLECGGKVTLIRTEEKDKYSAVQLEVDKTPKKKLKREFRVGTTALKVDDTLNVSIFEIGEKVQVSGISKAKGFQGGVKRHGFHGSPKTHGHKHDLRAPGSIGSGFPEHVTKGKRMAGRMGGVRSTSNNIKVAYIDKEKNLLGLEGSVPGIPGAIVEIYTKE